MASVPCEVAFEDLLAESFPAALALPAEAFVDVAVFARILCLRFEGRILILDMGWTVFQIFRGLVDVIFSDFLQLVEVESLSWVSDDFRFSLTSSLILDSSVSSAYDSTPSTADC